MPSKSADIKKDARLIIRVPRRLKDRLAGIERVYGVELPQIANECLTAFCEYVKQKEQMPTFPIVINPTDAATESQLKLSRRICHLSNYLNGPEAEYAAKKIKIKRSHSSRLRSRGPRISKSPEAKKIERPVWRRAGFSAAHLIMDVEHLPRRRFCEGGVSV
jgi:hypothetical protein